MVFVLDSQHDKYIHRDPRDYTQSPFGDRLVRIQKNFVLTLADHTIDDGKLPFNFAHTASGIVVAADGTVYFSGACAPRAQSACAT
jgi:hypothetical protein